MGISAFGASGIKPGICTSTTRPTSPYEGMVIYETDTDLAYVWSGSAWIRIYTQPVTTKGDIATYSTTPDRLSVGTNNRYLRANSAQSTGLEWSGASVGIELVQRTSFTNSTNLLMNGVFTSTYDNYKIFFNITNASATTGIFLRLASGSSVDASGIYLYGGFISYMGSSILTAVNNSGAGTDWYIGGYDSANYPLMPVSFEIMGPMLTVRTAMFSQGFQPVSPMPYFRCEGGVTTNTTQYDGFAIVPNSASFNLTGTISVYGYRTS